MILIQVAPASKQFSISSFSAFAGRWMIWNESRCAQMTSQREIRRDEPLLPLYDSRQKLAAALWREAAKPLYETQHTSPQTLAATDLLCPPSLPQCLRENRRDCIFSLISRIMNEWTRCCSGVQLDTRRVLWYEMYGYW